MPCILYVFFLLVLAFFVGLLHGWLYLVMGQMIVEAQGDSLGPVKLVYRVY